MFNLRSNEMQSMLTSKYYLIRIFKSKDMIDLTDALKAYSAFKRSRQEYSVKLYCESIRRGDPFGMMEAAALQLS